MNLIHLHYVYTKTRVHTALIHLRMDTCIQNHTRAHIYTCHIHTDSSKCSRNKVHRHRYGRKKGFRPPEPVYGTGQVGAVGVGGAHLCI